MQIYNFIKNSEMYLKHIVISRWL